MIKGNPTNDVAEQIIANLEGGRTAFVTASGIIIHSLLFILLFY